MQLFLQDLFEGFHNWRKWHLLGTQSIRSRYARSKLGQFWPSLSYLVTVLSLGVVYSFLWHVEVATFLPFLAVSHVFWTLIAGSVLEGCAAFTEYHSLIRTEYHPRSMFVLGLMVRQLTYFLHNAVVLIPLLIIFPRELGWTALLAIPGLIILLLNLYWMVFSLGLICARFRDLPNVVTSLMQIMFFVTPVVWEGDRINNKLAWLILTQLNPFSCLLSIVRDPIIGIIPSMTQYLVCLVMLVLGSLFALHLFNRGSRRLVYWL